MTFKAIVTFAALFVQTVYCQQCGCNSYGSQGTVSLGSLGYGSGISSCGSSGLSLGTSGLNYGSSNLGSVGSQDLGALAITVGSSYAPSGISVNADNLEIGGQLIVSGQFPVLGVVSISGDVPTGGQGQVQYSSASGVGLTTGGCGYGQATGVPNAGYGNSGNIGSSGLGFGGNSGLQLGPGPVQTCGCLY